MVSRRLRLGVAGAGVTLLIIITLSFLPTLTPRSNFSPPGPAILGFQAPDFSLPSDQGGSISLNQFRGRIVVINFAILVCCSDSAVEVFYMKEAYPNAQKHGVVFLTIAMKSVYNFYSPQEYRGILNFTWPLATDSAGTVQDIYSARETSTFIIDGGGIIRYIDHEITNSTTLISNLVVLWGQNGS